MRILDWLGRDLSGAFFVGLCPGFAATWQLDIKPKTVRLSSCHTEKLRHLGTILPDVKDKARAQETTVPTAPPQPQLKFVSGYEEDRIVQMYDTGISAAEVARRVNRPERTITDVLRRQGVEIRNCNRTVKADVSEMTKLYESGLSLAGVARALKVSRSTVGKYLTDAGITLRSRSAAAHLRANP